MKIRDDQATDNVISQCKALQAQPVIIHNDEQQSYWTGKRKISSSYVPLGLVCNTSSLEWQWSDGSAVDYKPSASEGGYYEGFDKDCTNGCVALIYNSTGYWARWCGTDVEPFDVYCTVQLQQPTPSVDGCESFEDDSEDGVCYQVGATAENWQDAQILCLKLGANLASIHSSQENSFIRRIAVSRGAVSGVYLGGTISGKGSDFGWIDGSAWDFTNFHSGFPITGAGDCLAMDTSTSSGQWMNIACTEKLPIVCIRDQKPVVEPTCTDGPWEEGHIITSPGFPYNASIPCDFFLIVDEGKKVEVDVVFLEANSCCDSLIIYDGYLGGHVIATLTGEIRNSTYTATSNTMRVSWAPNGGVNVKGMAVTYRAV